jgi:D-alanyl-D-alanine carboxypeptidase
MSSQNSGQWFEAKLHSTGMTRTAFKNATTLSYKSIRMYIAGEEPTLTADRWLLLARVLNVDLAELMEVFSTPRAN